MWSSGWGPQKMMNYFQEEMIHFFDVLVVFHFFLTKFTIFNLSIPPQSLPLEISFNNIHFSPFPGCPNLCYVSPLKCERGQVFLNVHDHCLKLY